MTKTSVIYAVLTIIGALAIATVVYVLKHEPGTGVAITSKGVAYSIFVTVFIVAVVFIATKVGVRR